MSNLTLDQVYNDWIATIFIYATDVEFPITIIMFPLVMYVIITQSTEAMSGYKLQMLYYFISNYIMEFILSVWKPIYLYPAPFAFSIGTTHIFGHSGGYFQYEILYFFIINMVFANYISMAYRLIMICGGYEFTFFKKFEHFFIFASSMLIMCLSFVLIPLFFSRLPTDQIYAIFAEEWPSLVSNLTNSSSLFGYRKDQIGYKIHMYSIWLILLSLAITVIVLELYMTPYLRRMKKIRSDSTFKLQLMIFQVINIQVCLNWIIICSGLWFTSSFIFGIKYGGPVTTITFCGTSYHAIIDSIITLYYIKPYRKYIKKKLEDLAVKFGIKTNIILLAHPAVVQTDPRAITIID